MAVIARHLEDVHIVWILFELIRLAPTLVQLFIVFVCRMREAFGRNDVLVRLGGIGLAQRRRSGVEWRSFGVWRDRVDDTLSRGETGLDIVLEVVGGHITPFHR